MKLFDISRKIIACCAASLMLLAGGCGEESSPAPNPPGEPSVSLSDTSGTDVSSGDVNPFDTGETGPAQAIIFNAEAMNARDIDAYMATIDPESNTLDSTREDAEYMFAHYRLAVTLDHIEIVSLKSDRAVVSVTQTTLPVPAAESEPVIGGDISASNVSASDASQLSGKDLTEKFIPCSTVLSHELICRDGKWYITSTTVNSYREISTQWDLFGAASAADPDSFVLSAGLPSSPSDSVSAADEAAQ